MRGLTKDFMDCLLKGNLKCFLEAVLSDDTLCLSIRDDYVNIYYRGGNMFRISKQKSDYIVSFDLGYSCARKTLLEQIQGNDYLAWHENIPNIKAEMDMWFKKHRNLEREHQQLILRDNNCSTISSGTDYFIADIEYADRENSSQFDMLAIKWPSTASDRKKNEVERLAFIEVKYGDKALKGSAGITKHFSDMLSFLQDSEKRESVFTAAETCFNQLVELGTIPDISKSIKVARDRPEYILLLINHDPASTILHTELQAYYKSEDFMRLQNLCDLKIAKASFMGYGLYESQMIDMESFIKTI